MKNVMRIAAVGIVVSLMFAPGAIGAVTEEPSLTYDAPFPGSDTGRIYYFVPKGLDLSKPAPLLVYMHGGNSKSPDMTPKKSLDRLMPTLCDAPFIVTAPSAPPCGRTLHRERRREGGDAAVHGVDEGQTPRALRT